MTTTMPLIENGRRGLRVEAFPIIDIHVHSPGVGDVVVPPLEVQVEEMDRLGVKYALVSSGHAILGDVQYGNDEIIGMMDRFPDHIGGYCFVTAQYPDLMMSEVERCFQHPGFRGIKVYQLGTDFDHPLFDPVWEFVNERKLPVLAHTWGGHLTGFDNAARKAPNGSFFAAHAGSGFAYASYIEQVRDIPNLYLDLTYSREHTNMIEHFVEMLGADRIVWGSDTPVFSMAQQLGKVLFARISDDDKKTILHSNAARILGM